MMRNFVRFLVGLVTGAVVGGVLALLFAPTSGEETRAKLEESLTHVRYEVKEAATAKAEVLKTDLARLQKKVIPE